MIRRVFIAPVCGLAVWLAAPELRAQRQVKTVDELAEAAAALEQTRAERLADKASVSLQLAEQNGEVAALKRQRSSWRRDRQLRAALSASQATAKQLAAIHQAIAALDVELVAARRALVKAADAELATQRDAARRTQVAAWRKRAAAALAPRSKRIVMPSDRIDPLADEAELREQAALIEDTVQKLEREESLLARRESRYDKMARLQKQHERADELAVFDDNQPRRTTSRQGGDDNRGGNGADVGGAGAPSEDDADGFGEDPAPPAPEAGFDSDPTIVLVEVVDSDTLDALRQAQRSDDPSLKAKAARRARDQVKLRRERLEKQREKISARLRALQRP
jgi:hypothetical protein